jgi:hypothetical protein
LPFVNVIISLMLTKFSLIWSATVAKFYLIWNQTINIRINPEWFYCFHQEKSGFKIADFHQSFHRLICPPTGGAPWIPILILIAIGWILEILHFRFLPTSNGISIPK